jgi:hypothetical protein
MMHAPTPPLEPDRAQIEKFVEAIFKHAGTEGFIAIRAFHQEGNKAFRFTPTALSGGLTFVIDVAEDDARRAAQNPKPVNFCPPLAVFANKERAREEDIIAGLVLSVECDTRPNSARLTLEQLLGQATVVVKSGGVWLDENGAAEDKLHLHWRLDVPVRDKSGLAKLKQARTLATAIVGGDPSNNPVCHPIRWPGSWHRKAEPRLCSIVTLNANVEIGLEAALATLLEAAPEAVQTSTEGNGVAEAHPGLVAAALAVTPNTFSNDEESWNGWVRMGLATYAASGGNEEGFTAFDQWSSKSPKHDHDHNVARWRGMTTSPPTRIGAGTLFHLAYEADRNWRNAFDRQMEAEICRVLSDEEHQAIFNELFPRAANADKKVDAAPSAEGATPTEPAAEQSAGGEQVNSTAAE